MTTPQENAPTTPADHDAQQDLVEEAVVAEAGAEKLHTAESVAAWLIRRISDTDPHPFPQTVAVREARQNFGDDWVGFNLKNVLSIHPDALSVFAATKPESIRWNTRAKTWWVASEEQLAAFAKSDAERAAKRAAKEA